MENAPYFAPIAEGPADAETFWLTCEDGCVSALGCGTATRPQAPSCCSPGRTEYIEKYGRTARELAARGLATLSIDWRGQGIADRLADDPATGHVHWFSDYQKT